MPAPALLPSPQGPPRKGKPRRFRDFPQCGNDAAPLENTGKAAAIIRGVLTLRHAGL